MISGINYVRLSYHISSKTRFSLQVFAMATSALSSESTLPVSANEPKSVHPMAEQGFNSDQALYESARPTYPRSVVEYVKSELVPQLSQSATAQKLTILDLAAGTGKWTRLLAPLGIGRLVALDPSPGMRSELKIQASSSDWPLKENLEVVDGSATALPFPDATFDTIFVAQAFHWFANVPSLTEMHRVLKSGGQVVMIWNLEDKRTPWVAQLRALQERFEGGTPQYRLGLWRKPFEEAESVAEVSKMFKLPYIRRQFTHKVVSTPTGLYQRALTKSYIALLGDREKAGLREEFEKVFASEGFPWYERDMREGGREKVVDVPLTTDVISFCRI